MGYFGRLCIPGLWTVRSRQYRRRFLRFMAFWKALAESYKIFQIYHQFIIFLQGTTPRAWAPSTRTRWGKKRFQNFIFCTSDFRTKFQKILWQSRQVGFPLPYRVIFLKYTPQAPFQRDRAPRLSCLHCRRIPLRENEKVGVVSRRMPTEYSQNDQLQKGANAHCEAIQNQLRKTWGVNQAGWVHILSRGSRHQKITFHEGAPWVRHFLLAEFASFPITYVFVYLQRRPPEW